MSEALYLYCLAPAHGLDAASVPVPPVTEGDPPGGLEHLVHEGIVALYSRVDATEFNDENLQSLAWLGPRAVAHAGVVQAAMAQGGVVLPVKFGTLFRGAESLNDFLRKHEVAIKAQLGRLEQQQEWSIKGFMDTPRVHERIKAEDPDIRERFEALPESPGKRYLLMKKLEQAIDTRARERLEARGREVIDSVKTLVSEDAALNIHGREAAGRDEPMVFNHSFLVHELQQQAFCARVEHLIRQEAGEGLILVLQGPWPPFNHCSDLTVTDAGDAANRGDVA
ncbi:GvpL/GvpF family gas vesicle protein [Ectothiorhodospira haloalkaliphila]|uniref:GvpL/GvpF family gas vesicle protein n=1 Tax=Ectothiorhodospira haloalkaliphila TaxID=421628 RepID=UPI001EE7CDEB|nr:GvpL/GvpF family gas vesicle protein [Ectothiorhodospira haloalkaliphila]MCG5526137.1 GvpL/GvpF family gas vesicle protein [Ectothiorhodospira haloalkaliphila]